MVDNDCFEKDVQIILKLNIPEKPIIYETKKFSMKDENGFGIVCEHINQIFAFSL